MLHNRKPGIYYPYSASLLREAVVSSVRKKDGEFKFVPYARGGELTFNNSVFMIKGIHDVNSWNFETGIVFMNFNGGEIPAKVFSRMECMLGLPLLVRSGEIYTIIGNKEINLPRSGVIPIRQILNNILCARNMPMDISNHNIFHGVNLHRSNSSYGWYLLRSGEESRAVEYMARTPEGQPYSAVRIVDRTTINNISLEQGMEEGRGEALEFKLYYSQREI